MSVGLDPNPGERYCPTCERTYVAGERCPEDDTRLVKLTKAIDTLIGRELDGRYTIVDKVGHGAMGAVYRGTQHSVGRDVAIKVVATSLVGDPILIKRFLREAKLASRLAHPNAVSVLDFGQTDDGLFFLVMELVDGCTLDAVIEAEGPLTPARVVRIGAQVCDALEGAHRLDIIHRDLKPANIMLLATGRDLVKVLDFGLAKSLTPDVSASTMTNAGALLGTPAFMPPELVTGGEVDGRSDLYSLGCVLYACASGRLPFSAGSIHELIAMHASEPPKPLVGIPAKLASTIARMLAKDPERRFRDARTTREALEAALDGGEREQAAEPTLVAESTTVLGWAGTVPVPAARTATRDVASTRQQALAKPAAAVDAVAKTSPARSLTEEESSPTLVASDRIAPIVKPAPARAPTRLSSQLPTAVDVHDAEMITARDPERARRRPLLLWLVLAVLAVAGAIVVYVATREPDGKAGPAVRELAPAQSMAPAPVSTGASSVEPGAGPASGSASSAPTVPHATSTSTSTTSTTTPPSTPSMKPTPPSTTSSTGTTTTSTTMPSTPTTTSTPTTPSPPSTPPSTPSTTSTPSPPSTTPTPPSTPPRTAPGPTPTKPHATTKLKPRPAASPSPAPPQPKQAPPPQPKQALPPPQPMPENPGPM